MKTRHLLQLAALSGLWGAGYLFTRMATPALGPALTAALRLGLGALTLMVIMRVLRLRWPREHWRELLLLGTLCLAGPHYLYAWSSLYLPAGYSAVLGVTSVLFGAFASTWMKEESLTQAKVLGCATAFLGVGLVVQLGPLRPTPDVVTAAFVALGGGLLSGGATPLLKRATQRMEPVAITFGIHLAAALILLPPALWSLPQAHFTPKAVGAVLIMGLFTSGLAYWFYMRIVKVVTPVAALSSTFMTTVFGVFWGHVFLGESFTLGSWIGAALVLVATMLVTGFNPVRRWWSMPAPRP